jgi:transcription elongation GreA/GreB family factor
MSRAFTKEDDAGDDLPERPVPAGPNYVTPRGLSLLEDAARELVEKRRAAVASGGDVKTIDRDLRYLEARMNSARVIPAGNGPEIRFGARVRVVDETGTESAFQIVGEDEARTDPALLSWTAPLANALFGAKEGDRVRWDGGETPTTFRVIEVRYGAG